MIYEDIIKWLKTLQYWQQKIAYDILNNKPIDQDYENKVFDILLQELELSDTLLQKENLKFDLISTEKNCEKITWRGVSNLVGINRISSAQPLEVGDHLTIIYGENGSGKSGYTRLLNNAFVSRGDKTLLSNVYKEKVVPSAEFIFKVSDEIKTYNYPKDINNSIFKTVMVFDTKSATEDVNKESEVSFKPSALMFFDKFMEICQKVLERFDALLQEKRNIKNPILKDFDPESEIYNDIKDIKTEDQIDNIKSKYQLTEDEKNNYTEINKRIAEIDSMNIEKQHDKLFKVKRLIEDIEVEIDEFKRLLSSDKIKEYETIINDRKLLLKERTQNDIVKDIGIDNPTGEWRTFVGAAKRYWDSVEDHEHCPLCGNEVNKENKIYIIWKHLESTIEKSLENYNQRIREIIDNIQRLKFRLVEEDTVAKEWLLQNVPVMEDVIGYYEKTKELQKKVLNMLMQNSTENCKSIDYNESVLSIIRQKVEEKEKELNLEFQIKKKEELSLKKNEYWNREHLLCIIDNVREFIKIQSWIKKATNLNSSSIKKKITKEQGDLFDKYVTEEYTSIFYKECKNLNADFDTEIVSKNSKAQRKRSLKIKDHNAGEILSEGEQKVIALANFLTEAHMDERNVAIVLDDPVCSMDHIRTDNIAQRLVEESKNRQVIIFTHNIAFFLDISMAAEEERVDVKTIRIRKVEDNTGCLYEDEPWEGLPIKKRMKRLHSGLQKLEVMSRKEPDMFPIQAKGWCELLRETWERSIEELLLENGIRRFSYAIETKKLAKASFCKEYMNDVVKGMTETSKYVHDKASGAMVRDPVYNNLEELMKDFDDFYQKLRPSEK